MAIGGSGTQEDPWTINSAEDLFSFAKDSTYWKSGTYTKLTRNINVDGLTWSAVNYNGIFDGNHYTISNIYPTSLFSTMGGTVKNLKCKGYKITQLASSSSSGIGNIAANGGGTISNCCVQNCNINGYDISWAGCIAGYFDGHMYNCYSINNTIHISSSSSSSCGGLVGWAGFGSSMEKCYAYNNTLYAGTHIGGLCGVVSHTDTGTNVEVLDCATYGGTHGNKLLGYPESITGISNCYTSNDVTSEIFHTKGFWDGTKVGSTTYLSWNFTDVWKWDSSDKLPKLRGFNTPTNTNAYVRVNGDWKKANNVYIKSDGNWINK